MASREAKRLLARASYGARPGELEALERAGERAWLERQLRPDSIDDAAAEGRLDAVRRSELEPGDLGAAASSAMRMSKIRLLNWIVAGRLVRAVHSERQLFELMVDFWGDHFNVYKGAQSVGHALPHYEYMVLRQHALGRFEDLLVAVARSPAMLIYLDNRRSLAPAMRSDGTPKPHRGINENYARELLELHTLGVDRGYTQNDVVEVARVFTGWGVAKDPGFHFRFNPGGHDWGAKRVMGERVAPSGMDEGLDLLHRLAHHPSTARHVSIKLARRFVADDPPPELVERAARNYEETGGRIDEVLRVILLSPELSDPGKRKLKTHFELAVSVLRASGGYTDGGFRLRAPLIRMGGLPYYARTPDGYPDRAEDWADPASLLARMNLALALAKRGWEGTRPGPELPPHGRDTDLAESKRERIALAFAGPAFQWR